MFTAASSPYLVPFDGSFELQEFPTRPPKKCGDKKSLKRKLSASVDELSDLQEILYAQNSYSILLVFQAMDAAGKDSTIRAVLSGVNPAGCQVHSFKRPSSRELDHDFLWRTTRTLPQRGRIGVYNRSYYEEVLAVRVHPEFLGPQNLPHEKSLDQLWQDRFESIRDQEKHLARSGTIILKFWLNVSLGEQRDRLLSRLNEPEKHWKFEAADLDERELWPQYMHAYQDALNQTSREHAPWYAIPADNKPFMRAAIADIIVRSLESLELKWPSLSKSELSRFGEMRKRLGEKQD